MSATNTSLPLPVMDAAPRQDPWARPQRDPMAKQARTGTGKREPSVKPSPSPLQCHRPSPAEAQPSAETGANRVPLAQLRPRREQGRPTLSRGPGDTLSPWVPRPQRPSPGPPGPPRAPPPPEPADARQSPLPPVGCRPTSPGGCVEGGAVWRPQDSPWRAMRGRVGRAVSPWRQRSSGRASAPLSGGAGRGGRHLNRGGGASPPAGRPLAESTEGAGRGTAPTDAPPPLTWGPPGAAPRGPPGPPEPRGHPGPLGPWSHRDPRDIQHLCDL